MCEYCEESEIGTFRELTDDCPNARFYADLGFGKLYLEYTEDEETDYALVEINYCPMCGRKLAERGK